MEVTNIIHIILVLVFLVVGYYNGFVDWILPNALKHNKKIKPRDTTDEPTPEEIAKRIKESSKRDRRLD